MQHIPVLKVTINAVMDIPRHRFVGFDSKQTTADQPIYGVTLSDARKDYDTAIQVIGIAYIECAAALNLGDWVKSNADGCAVSCAATAAGKIGQVTSPTQTTGEFALILIR
jgi:hypothetical protein